LVLGLLSLGLLGIGSKLIKRWSTATL
jgi:hypothetical protein